MPLKKKSKNLLLRRELKAATERANRLCLSSAFPDKVEEDVDDEDDDDVRDIFTAKKSLREVSREVALVSPNFLDDGSSQCSSRSSTRADSSLPTSDDDDLKAVFEIFDVDKIGWISFRDLKGALCFLQFKFTDHDLQRVMQSAFQQQTTKTTTRDINENKIDFVFFCRCVLRMEETSNNIRKEIEDGFEQFDCEQRGRITLQNLKFLNKRHNLGLANSELQEMLEQGDNDGDGFVDKEEFVKLMSKSHIFS